MTVKDTTHENSQSKMKWQRLSIRVAFIYVATLTVAVLVTTAVGGFMLSRTDIHVGWLVWGSIVIILLTGFISYLSIHRLVFMPLDKLAQSTQQMNTDTAIYGIDREDEIGMLAQSIHEMHSHLSESNIELIDLMQERDYQMLLMGTVDEVTASLLGMPDDNLEEFSQSLIDSIRTVCRCGDVGSIYVHYNEQIGNEQYYTCQLSFEFETNSADDDTGTMYAYSATPGWYERLATGEIINMSVLNMSDAEKKHMATDALSILVVPVFFHSQFWGIVWYEDFNKTDEFETHRVGLLKSASLMIVSAVRRKSQAELIYDAAKRQKLMLDTMPICCHILNKNAQVVEANTKSIEFFKFKIREELIERFHETFPEYQPNGRRSTELAEEYILKAFEHGILEFEWMHIIPETNEQIPTEVTLISTQYNGEYVVACYIRDIREHLRMMKEIEHRGNLLYTMNAASNILLQSAASEFESSLFRSLGMMSRAVDVERVFVWEYITENNETFFTQIYEWIGDTTIFERQNQKIPHCMGVVDIEKRMLRGLCISGATKDLPPDTRAAFMLNEAKSYLLIPVFLRGGQLWGIVGFGDMRNERVFSESDESILRSGGLLLANALLRHEMTQNLQETLVEAQAANKAKSNFLSTMSHEMRTPMNAITGMCAIGRESDDVSRKDYAFDRIEEASSHLLGVINDVLDMSKIEAGKLELSAVTFDIYRVIDKVNAVIQFRIDEKNQHFECNVADDVPRMLIADDQRLAQVLTNLLSNAVKFTENDKKISLNIKLLEKTDAHCTLQFDVVDQGIGLSPAQQGILFKSFVQAEASTSRKFGGTGLGLAISKHIVDLMGGDVWIESELGQGATFSFTLKAELPDEASVIETKEASVVASSKEEDNYIGRHLLLAEDVEINREIVMVMLEDSGLMIDIAENGKEALSMFETAPDKYDLIFMDVHMPIMDGYEATSKIRALPTPYAKTVPIVAMTANVFKEDIKKCLEAGMNAHLGKPLDFDAVRDTIKKYLS